MLRIAFPTALVALFVPGAAQAQALPGKAPLPVEELAQLRGGFQLPGGVAVTFGVTTSTRLDGREILRSTLNMRDGRPDVTVLAADPSGRGVSQVRTTAEGTSVATRDGLVQVRGAPGGVRIDLAGDGLDVSHLVGRAIGSVVANTGNDRTIDTTTSIDIGLGGIRPDAVGGAAMRIENLALDATTRLVR